ncbi:serine/threonine-protein kinase [Massilia sp. Leaf139]|uniref:serine/threonine protein kinase n=1 Tax=Massilia sp. Leaf139 TaxID=1736272 RepID=UPI00070009E2|nr:serine/threonine-protein kinase [Massilia sp. Leaf139]KQQ88076.1 hypothetical protein ASF77_15305 [Massilia sp. Leaf139]
MTDPKKIAEIHALTRPSVQTRPGAAASAEDWDDHSLPLGSRVSEFEITGIIGKGGFGIVYLAWDHSLDRVVALKEYMPASFASRKSQTQVSPLSERHRETFQVGLNSFVNEAKLLAQFHSPSLVEVHRFWEANGTAYMVMPYYRGKTLGETVRAFSGPPDEAWLLDLLAPLTEALMELHSVQCYHRDIAPDNILILDDTRSPLLLDFGAARRVIAGQAHALTIILKAGYAPVEQYGEIPGMEQGPWTDVYALASVVYWAVTGNTPPAATSRMIRDSYVPLAECAPAQYSRAFAAAIDRALAVLPEARTQSIEALRGDLGLGPSTVRRTAAPFRWSDADATVVMVPRTGAQGLTGTPPTPTAPARVEQAQTVVPPLPPTEQAPPLQKPRKHPLAAMIGAALLAAAAGGVWFFQSGGDAPPPAPVVAERPASVPSAPPASPPAPSPAQAVPVPQSAADALALLLVSRDPALGVSAGLEEKNAGAARRLRYTSGEPGRAYLIGLRDGLDEPLRLLSPAPETPLRTQAKGTLDLPDELKPGAWKLVLIIARQPLNPGAQGWNAEGGTWTWRPGAKLPWDIPACAPERAPCVAAYGAAAVETTVEAAVVARPAPAPPAGATRKSEHARPQNSPERSKPAPAKAKADPECERILVRMSLGESSQELIDRMKTLKCN